MHPRVEELVRQLDLAPHPEGGYFRETSRSPIAVAPGDGRPARSAITGIYYLLGKGQHSAWHVVDSDEIWTHFEGGPVRLWTYDPAGGRVTQELLGPLGVEGCEPQRVVGAGVWQSAEPVGEFAFGGCFVGPGFDFADFRLLEAAPAARWAIERLAPELMRLA